MRDRRRPARPLRGPGRPGEPLPDDRPRHPGDRAPHERRPQLGVDRVGRRRARLCVRCEGGGEIRVDTFTGPAGDASFGSVIDAAQAAGYDDPASKYSIFYESNAAGSCGVGTYWEDERLSADNYTNRNDLESSYALTYDGCWTGSTPMHENGHNMGAVQPGAPKSTGSGGHCYQERDVMCYSPDGGDRNQGGEVLDCADHLHFDCGHDDYFDAAPEAGEYLASRWNIGSPLNRFLAFGGTEPNTPPGAAFDHACTELECSFLDTSTDGDGTIAARSWSFGDGATSAAASPSHTFPRDGTYNVSLTVTDDRGAKSTTTRAVTVASINDAPTAAADTAAVEKSVARDLLVLANDRDPDGDALRVTAVSAPLHGSASVSSDGQSVRYVPSPGWVGPDSLTYTVSDGRGGQATATVAITVRDTIAPKVSAVAPTNGARTVSRAANVTARFSEPMKAATVNRTTVQLLRRGTSTPVRATVRYDTATKTAVLDPAASLAPRRDLHGDRPPRRPRSVRQLSRRRAELELHGAAVTAPVADERV